MQCHVAARGTTSSGHCIGHGLRKLQSGTSASDGMLPQEAQAKETLPDSVASLPVMACLIIMRTGRLNAGKESIFLPYPPSKLEGFPSH